MQEVIPFAELPLFDKILAISIIVLVCVVFVSLIIIFIGHLLMPKKVLTTYFKPPHFSEMEVEMFTGFPFGYMRTGMFMTALGFPSRGKRRGIQDAYKLAPVWYCKFSKYFMAFIVIWAALLVLVTVIGTIKLELWKL